MGQSFNHDVHIRKAIVLSEPVFGEQSLGRLEMMQGDSIGPHIRVTKRKSWLTQRGATNDHGRTA